MAAADVNLVIWAFKRMPGRKTIRASRWKYFLVALVTVFLFRAKLFTNHTIHKDMMDTATQYTSRNIYNKNSTVGVIVIDVLLIDLIFQARLVSYNFKVQRGVIEKSHHNKIGIR